MGSGGSGGLYRPSAEMMEQMGGSKELRIAELEARVLDLESAIRYATYLDRQRMTVHASHYAYVDLGEHAPILRDVHTKHPLKV